MKNRRFSDIFAACFDGLTGFADAIHTAYPETKVQRCAVYLVRAALRTHRVFVLNISRTIRRRRTVSAIGPIRHRLRTHRVFVLNISRTIRRRRTVSAIGPIRHRLRYVSDKDSKAVARDLKRIYNAVTLFERDPAPSELGYPFRQ